MNEACAREARGGSLKKIRFALRAPGISSLPHGDGALIAGIGIAVSVSAWVSVSLSQRHCIGGGFLYDIGDI